jgi:lipid A 3-O-deacylase
MRRTSDRPSPAMIPTLCLTLCAALCALSAPAAAQDSPATLPEAAAPSSSLDQPAQLRLQAAATTQADFTKKGTQWWTLGLGVAKDSRSLVEGQIFGQYSTFVEDDIEVIAELSVRTFNQDGENATGINPAVVFRWHFWESDEAATWTAFVDAGIGVMLTTDDVPEEATSFNFTPRAGVGLTYALTEHTRLIAGLRWSHISNARIWGNDDNPGSDALMLNLGVNWAF